MNNNYDICPLILEEYDDNPATQKAEIQTNGKPLSDAFLEVLGAICKSFVSWGNASKIARDFSLKLSFDLEREPMVTDLPIIRFLMEFDDYFYRQSDYERNVECINRVEANNPFYKIETGNPMLPFSPRLVFCQTLLESAINRSINDVFAPLYEKGDALDDRLEEIYADSTKDSIHDIVTYLKQFFYNRDSEQRWWKEIVSDLQNAYFEPSDEQIVFYHLLAAQMCRYWLEIKRRMKCRMDELEVEVFRFYRTYLGILPDTGIIDIVPADKPEKPTAECKEKTNTEKKPATPKKDEKKMRRASFIINEKDSKNRDDTVTALFNILCNKNIIPTEDKRAFTCLLSGGTSSKPIHWRREYKVLLGLFFQDMHAIIINKYGKRVPIMFGERGRIKKEEMQRFVTVSKEGASFWEVVYEWFVDEDGNYYEPKKDKLKDATFAKKWADILVDLHRALLGIGKKQDPPKFR